MKKIHLQLRHGTKTTSEEYIRAAVLRSSDAESSINEVLLQCNCRLAHRLKPHTKVGTRPPGTNIQNQVSIGVIHFKGTNFLHSVNHRSARLETCIFSRKSIHVRNNVLHRMQLLPHGHLELTHCDYEYETNNLRSSAKTVA